MTSSMVYRGELFGYLLEWAADERGIDSEKVSEYVTNSESNGRELALPIIPIAVLQQILGFREKLWTKDIQASDSNIGTGCASAGQSGLLSWRIERRRDSVHEFTTQVLSTRSFAPPVKDSYQEDERITLEKVIREIAGFQGEGDSINKVAVADRSIKRHCLNEVDCARLGAHRSNSVVRDLSEQEALSVFISSRSTDPKVLGKRGNPGDAFSIPVAAHLSRRPIEPRGVWAEKNEPLLFTVGSVLQHVGDRGLTWGTGAIAALTGVPKSKISPSLFLAVRGPRTRDQVVLRTGQNPAVVSDPGLLLPLVIPTEPNEPDIEIGYLPHGVDRADFESLYAGKFIIDNYSGLNILVENINRCCRIVSSSLHGMIFAHALGKPAMLVNIADRITGGDFKFIDYLCSIGVYDFHPRQCPSNLPIGATYYVESRHLDQLTSELTSTFPTTLLSAFRN